MSNRGVNVCLAGTALLLSACQSASVSARAPDYTQYDQTYTANLPYQGGGGYDQRPAYSPVSVPNIPPSPASGYADYADVEPSAGPASATSSGGYAPPQTSVAAQMPTQQSGALEAEMIRLQERLQRVERAMLRLDRRMQLVERNELGRMSGSVSMNDAEEQSAMAEMDLGPRAVTAPAYGDGFQAVATPITSALQAAPKNVSRATSDTPSQMAMRSLPSLADQSSSGVKQSGDVAIWTVHYDMDKVWPARDQLPASRDVVALLRENKNLSIFARGNQPNSVEFRERVKALSRYLSKVSSQESVPIAAMSASHLDKDTIEIFASQ